jgi:lysyl-tRNA synthetase class II
MQAQELEELRNGPRNPFTTVQGSYGTLNISRKLTAAGRIQSVRLSGSKLAFLDIEQSQQKLQVLLNVKHLGVEVERFRESRQLLRRGDVICEMLPCLSRR